MPARNNRLEIKKGEIVNPEQLLRIPEMVEEDFKQVIAIIFSRISECLHKDVNKSCFTLRMIYYKNLCSVLEHLIEYLSDSKIEELFYYLVKPLSEVKANDMLEIQHS